MPDRAFMYCPFCAKDGVKAELFRGNPEMHLFRCMMQHAFTYQQLESMNVEKIKLEVVEKPLPTDIKAEVWVSPELWQRFRAKYPVQSNATMQSIMSLMLDDDLVIISGDQARKLKALNVKTGADMLSCAEEQKRLEGENADLVRENGKFYAAIRGEMANVS
ncbi:MAG TPA: hypothetical protein VE779_11465 [Candidatus Angelobacter sp.]|nr:hypothetical protein [Candidatus Angelobacter sp.]